MSYYPPSKQKKIIEEVKVVEKLLGTKFIWKKERAENGDYVFTQDEECERINNAIVSMRNFDDVQKYP